MPEIYPHIANATGELDNLQGLITRSFEYVLPIVEKDLRANQIDVIFVSAPALTIPEYGIGGNCPGPHHVYVSFDPQSDKITKEGLDESLFHEMHHAMRYRDPGYGETLGEAMISEGLACLYEEQVTGNVPIYARVAVSDKQIALAEAKLEDNHYDHSAWFFGTGDIIRWFGYSYGYKLCKKYSDKHNKSASELVHTPAHVILGKQSD